MAHVQFASKYRNCTCPSSIRFAVMYNYTRNFQLIGDSVVYLFTPQTSALRYGCPDLRNRLVTKPKSLKHMYIFDRLVDFVHESRRFSGVSGGCIFTHPLSEGQFQVAGSQLHVHGVFTAARVMFAVVVVIISIVALRVVYIHVTAVQVCGQVVTGSGEGCCYRSIPGAGSD